MTLNPINIQSVIQETEALVEQDQSLAPAIKTAIRLLITIILLLSRKFKLDSHNSSMPPSADGNREKGSKKIRVIKSLGVKKVIKDIELKRSRTQIGLNLLQLIDVNCLRGFIERWDLNHDK